jgi:hypothetical protein
MAQTLIRHEQIEDVYAFRASLGSLAVLNNITYSTISGLPSLGSLAVLNDLSYTSLLNLPSLGSLAAINSVTQEYLPSTASFNDLYTTTLTTGGHAVTSTASIRNLRSTGIIASNVTITGALDVASIFGINFLGVASLVNTDSLGATNAVISTATVGTIYADTYENLPAVSFTSLTNLPSLGSLAILNDLSYTSLLNLPSLGSLAQISDVVSPLVLSGATLSLSQASIVHNSLGGLTTGDAHTQYALLAGRVGGQNLIGGTGNNEVLFFQANTALSNTPTSDAFRWRAGQNGGNTRMILRHDGALGVNNTSPNAGLHVTTGLTAVAGYANGMQVNLNINKVTDDAIGAFFDVSDVAGGVKTIYGHRARITFDALASTSLSGLQATSNQAIIRGGGDVGTAEILTSNMEVTGNSWVNDANMIKIFSPTINTGGYIKNLKGLYLGSMSGASDSNYSIYSEGGTMFHESPVLIGNTGYLSIRDGSVTPINAIAAGDILTGTTAGIFQMDISTSQAIFQRSSADAVGNYITFRKTRGSTTSPTVATTGDSAGVIRAYTYDGAAYDEITRIEMESVSAQNSGAIRFWTMNAGTIGERLSILNDGDVGVGVAAPSQKLDVNGRIRMATWTADGDTAAYRDTATNCIALIASDQRLKKDLEVISNPIEKVKAITGYTYRKIDDEPTEKKKYGVMAQDVLAVAPELTFTFTNEDDPETYYGVHYDKLPTLLLEAIKEQQKIIEDLKARIEVLEAQ